MLGKEAVFVLRHDCWIVASQHLVAIGDDGMAGKSRFWLLGCVLLYMGRSSLNIACSGALDTKGESLMQEQNETKVSSDHVSLLLQEISGSCTMDMWPQ